MAKLIAGKSKLSKAQIKNALQVAILVYDTPTFDKATALKVMELGAKITHPLFSPEEWMTIENGMIVFEDGVECSVEEFFRFRPDDDGWNESYSLWVKP